jgi:hypothetical protein
LHAAVLVPHKHDDSMYSKVKVLPIGANSRPL